MTRQSSDTECGPPPGRRRPSAAGREAGPLDAFLRSVPQTWGMPPGLGGNGFAALRFDASPGSAARTRGFLRSTLTGWQLPELVDDATTVAAELVANAVTHALRSPAVPAAPPATPVPPAKPVAHTPARPVAVPPAPPADRPPAAPAAAEASAWIALVRVDGAVVCAVADPSPALPALCEPSPLAESGRGLRIVAELSDSWGHSAPEPAGKTVWARLGTAGGHA